MEGGSLDECLNLLKGNNDEQRLVGLLLATKFVAGEDVEAVRKVYNAIGFHFINRLLKTGMGQFASVKDQQQSYLHLAVSILAAFSRIPDLASTDDMISKVPDFVQVLRNKEEGAVVMDACECLLAIAAASEKGFTAVCQSSAFPVIGNILQHYSPDAQEVTIAVKVTHFLVSKIIMENKVTENAEQLASIVPSLARHISCQQSILKFEVLEILRILLMAAPVRIILRITDATGSWLADVRTGLGQILHSRVGPEHRNGALELAAAMIEFTGSSWLIGEIGFPDTSVRVPSDRFLFLLVESLRVEIPIVLGEISQTRNDFRDNQQFSVSTTEKHQSLATYYALLEHIINFISEAGETSTELDSRSLQSIVTALDDIVGIVFELLEDAKDHGANRGDELLSCVRLVGRYLAEVPSAHNARCLKLLGFVLSIGTEGEESQFYAVRFMLPALCQITMNESGCEALVSCGGHKQVVSFVTAALENREENLIIEACDVLLNVLVKKDNLLHELSYLDFVPALPPLAAWAVKANQSMEVALATCLCITVLNMTSEDALNGPLGANDLDVIYNLIGKCLQRCHQGEAAQEADLMDMIISGCMTCLTRYPSLESTLRSSAWLLDGRSSNSGDANFHMLVAALKR